MARLLNRKLCQFLAGRMGVQHAPAERVYDRLRGGGVLGGKFDATATDAAWLLVSLAFTLDGTAAAEASLRAYEPGGYALRHLADTLSHPYPAKVMPRMEVAAGMGTLRLHYASSGSEVLACWTVDPGHYSRACCTVQVSPIVLADAARSVAEGAVC